MWSQKPIRPLIATFTTSRPARQPCATHFMTWLPSATCPSLWHHPLSTYISSYLPIHLLSAYVPSPQAAPCTISNQLQEVNMHRKSLAILGTSSEAQGTHGSKKIQKHSHCMARPTKKNAYQDLYGRRGARGGHSPTWRSSASMRSMASDVTAWHTKPINQSLPRDCMPKRPPHCRFGMPQSMSAP